MALSLGALGTGCGKPAATESTQATAVAETPAPAAAPAANVTPEPSMPAAPVDAPAIEPPAEPVSAEEPSAPSEPAAADAADDSWEVGAEWDEKLVAEPADFGGYGLRVPVGFTEAARGSDRPDSPQPFMIGYQGPAQEGATPAVIAATFHPPSQQYPAHDAMLAAMFANISTTWPNSERQKTEHGKIGDFPASRMAYHATLPNEQSIAAVVYLIDDGDRRIVFQGVANPTSPDYPLELIDAAIRTFAKRAEPETPPN
ncbi:MAG: hypothetical protein KF708_12810 [Pirellulales bacterium]|nr:hypothetical protein [Pirellulales bacterium]